MDRRWLVWCLFLVGWTAMLLVPGSVHEQLSLGEVVWTRKAFIAKSAHVLGFAAFAVITGWLRVPLPWRPPLMFLLMFHAVATEFLQDFVPGRTATLSDALFNHLGIALGVALTWKWWTHTPIHR